MLRRKQSMLMKPEGSVERHQTLSSRVGSGHETTVNVNQGIKTGEVWYRTHAVLDWGHHTLARLR